MSALYQEEIADCCRHLRLSSILAEFAMTTECDTNQEYLYQVLSRTIAYCQDCRIGKLISAAGFPKPYDFSQFRADEVKFQTECSLESLKSLKFRHQGRNLIMYGGTGTEKTMLSICIGIRLCESEIPVRFFHTAALINRLSEQKAAGTLSHFLKKLNKTEVIILDELWVCPVRPHRVAAPVRLSL